MIKRNAFKSEYQYNITNFHSKTYPDFGFALSSFITGSRNPTNEINHKIFLLKFYLKDVKSRS